MRRTIFAIGFAAMAAAFSMPVVLQAHDSPNRRDGGTQAMGPGMMNGNGQMSQMMDHCSQMMQGTSAKPNEQWRDGTPPVKGPMDKKQ